MDLATSPPPVGTSPLLTGSGAARECVVKDAADGVKMS